MRQLLPSLEHEVRVRLVGFCPLSGDTRYEITHGTRCSEIAITAEGTVRNDALLRSSWQVRHGFPFNTAILAIERFRIATRIEDLAFIAARNLHRFVNPILVDEFFPSTNFAQSESLETA